MHKLEKSLHSRINWLWVVLLFLLILVLAAPGLTEIFWVDEVVSVMRAGEPRHGGPLSPAEIWERTSAVYDQLPGYYMLLAAWSSLVGWSEVATRWLSLLLGFLALSWTYRIGRDWHSPLAGLAAAVVLGSGAFFVDFLHEVRTYALSMCLGAVAIWLYIRIVERRAALWQQISFILVVAGILYSHYFNFILIAAICFYHALFVWRKAKSSWSILGKDLEWFRVVVLMGLAGLLFLPWMFGGFSVFQGVDDNQWRTVLAFSNIETIYIPLMMFSNGALLAVFIFGAFGLQRRGKSWVAWGLLLLAVAILMLINNWLHMLVSTRLILILWILIALVMGFGIANAVKRGIPAWIILSLWLGFGALIMLVPTLNPYLSQRIDRDIKYIAWDTTVELMEQLADRDETLLFSLLIEAWDGAHELNVEHYFHDYPIEVILMPSFPQPQRPNVDYLRHLTPVIDRVTQQDRIWHGFATKLGVERAVVMKDLMAEYGITDCGIVIELPDITLELLARIEAEDMAYQFNGDDYIRMGTLVPPNIINDETMVVTLSWLQTDNVPRQTYSYAVHIKDATGSLVAQSDTGLPVDDVGCQTTQINVAELPAGEYQVDLLVYSWEDGVRLPAQSSDFSDDFVPIGTIER